MNISIKNDWPIICMAALFIIKAIYLAFFVTPLWDIPDETGHYAYAEDLAYGRGLPLLGKAEISSEVNSSVAGEYSPASGNWIAQHPPLYYGLAAIPLKIASLISENQDFRFRAPRIISAIAGGVALIVLYRTLIFLSLDRRFATAIASAIGFVPMFSHLASGTNHDVSLFLFCSLVAHSFIKYMTNRQLSDAYICAFWLMVATSTKLTALVLLAPVVAILIFEIDGCIKRIVKHAIGIMLVALSLPAGWFARNIWHFGNPFTTAVGQVPMPNGVKPSFWQFMHDNPVMEHFILNFFGLFGWIGTGNGEVEWFQIYGFPLAGYSLIFLGFSVVISFGASIYLFNPPMAAFPSKRGPLINYFWIGYEQLCTWRRARYAAAVVVAMATTSFVLLWKTHPQSTDGIRAIAAISLIYAASISFFLIISGRQSEDKRMFAYSVLIFGFFSLILVREVYSVSNVLGQMRATHGRYIYPALPLLIIALGILATRCKSIGFAAIAAVTLMVILEFQTFSTQVIPFYAPSVDRVVDARPLVNHTPAGELTKGTEIEQEFFISLKEQSIISSQTIACVQIFSATYVRNNIGLARISVLAPGWRITGTLDYKETPDNNFATVCEPVENHASLQSSPVIRIKSLDGAPGSSITVWLTDDSSNGTAIINGEKTNKSLVFTISAPINPMVHLTRKAIIAILCFISVIVILFSGVQKELFGMRGNRQIR